MTDNAQPITLPLTDRDLIRIAKARGIATSGLSRLDILRLLQAQAEAPGGGDTA